MPQQRACPRWGVKSVTEVSSPSKGMEFGETRNRPYIARMNAHEDPSETDNALLRELPADLSASARAPWVAVIRSLGVRHRGRIARHLKALDAHDRYLRFGYMATDEQIQSYVNGLDFERDAIFGIYNRRLELVAMAHLAHSVDRRLRRVWRLRAVLGARAWLWQQAV